MKRIAILALTLALGLSMSGCKFMFMPSGREPAPTASAQPSSPVSSSPIPETESGTKPTPASKLDGSTPRGTVSLAMDALKEADGKAFSQYAQSKNGSGHIIGERGNEPEMAFVKELFRNLSYEVQSEIVDGDSATVRLKVVNRDHSEGIKAFTKAVLENFTRLGDDGDAYVELLTQTLHDLPDSTYSEELEIVVEKVDGNWKLLYDEAYANAVSGNMLADLSSVKELADSFTHMTSQGE